MYVRVFLQINKNFLPIKAECLVCSVFGCPTQIAAENNLQPDDLSGSCRNKKLRRWMYVYMPWKKQKHNSYLRETTSWLCLLLLVSCSFDAFSPFAITSWQICATDKADNTLWSEKLMWWSCSLLRISLRWYCMFSHYVWIPCFPALPQALIFWLIKAKFRKWLQTCNCNYIRRKRQIVSGRRKTRFHKMSNWRNLALEKQCLVWKQSCLIRRNTMSLSHRQNQTRHWQCLAVYNTVQIKFVLADGPPEAVFLSRLVEIFTRSLIKKNSVKWTTLHKFLSEFQQKLKVEWGRDWSTWTTLSSQHISAKPKVWYLLIKAEVHSSNYVSPKRQLWDTHIEAQQEIN